MLAAGRLPDYHATMDRKTIAHFRGPMLTDDVSFSHGFLLYQKELLKRCIARLEEMARHRAQSEGRSLVEPDDAHRVALTALTEAYVSLCDLPN